MFFFLVFPFSLCCHNQTGRNHKDFFLLVEILAADNQLLQVCQIDVFNEEVLKFSSPKMFL